MSETIRIPITTTNTSFVEIKLPVFRKSIAHFYKVFSKNQCIQVFDYYKFDHTNHNGGIQFADANLAYHGNDTVDCSESEFMEAYEATEKQLREIATALSEKP